MLEEKVELTIQINKIALMVFRTALLLNGKNREKDADQVIEELIDGYSDAVLTKLEKAREERRKARQSDKEAKSDPEEPKSDSFLIYKTARAIVMPEGTDEDVRADLEEQKRRVECKRTEGKIKRWAEKRDSVPYFILRSFLCVCPVEGREEKQKVEDVFVVECQKVQKGGTDEELRQRFARNFAQMKIARDNSHGLIFGESDGKIFIREEFRELIRGLENKFLAEPKNTEEGEAQ